MAVAAAIIIPLSARSYLRIDPLSWRYRQRQLHLTFLLSAMIDRSDLAIPLIFIAASSIGPIAVLALAGGM